MGNQKNIFDIVRGEGICFVILGHIIQYIISPSDFDHNIFFRLIYSFHMPLFMFISGALVYNSKRPLNAKWVQKKFMTLAVPFFVWIPLIYTIGQTYKLMSFMDYLIHVIKSPDYARWFLWVLFLLHMLMFILTFLKEALCKAVKGSLKIPSVELLIECGIFVLIDALFLPVLHLHIPILGIGMCIWYFAFYFIGYICNKLNFIQKLCKWRWRFIAVPVFICVALFWRRTEGTFVKQEWLESIIHIPMLTRMFVMVYKYLVPCLGIFGAFALATYLSEKFGRLLAYFGVHTMSIYLIHIFLLKSYCKESVVVSAIVSFILSLVIPIAVERLAEYMGISGPLFGKYRKSTL